MKTHVKPGDLIRFSKDLIRFYDELETSSQPSSEPENERRSMKTKGTLMLVISTIRTKRNGSDRRWSWLCVLASTGSVCWIDMFDNEITILK
jgi:hypothetical protein